MIRKFLGGNRQNQANHEALPRAGKRGLLRHPAGLMLVGAMLFTTSAGVALPPITAAADLLAMMAARSPGLREAGALSTKHAFDSLAEHEPKSDLWKPDVAPIPDASALPPDPGALPVGGGESPAGLGGVDRFGSDESFFPGIFPGGGFPIGGGPGEISHGGGGGGTTPTSPVPETGFWIMMILGIAMLGARLRRQPRIRCA